MATPPVQTWASARPTGAAMQFAQGGGATPPPAPSPTGASYQEAQAPMVNQQIGGGGSSSMPSVGGLGSFGGMNYSKPSGFQGLGGESGSTGQGPNGGGGPSPSSTSGDGVPLWMRSGAPPATQTFGTGNNLISTQFNPTPSAQTQYAQGVANTALNNYSNYQPKPFQSIAGPDTSQTQGLYGQANAQVQGLHAAGYNPVAGTDQTASQNYLNQAAGNIQQAQQQFGGLGQMGGFGYAGDTGQVRASTLGQLNQTLSNTPDRAQLAADAYKLLEERAQPQYEQAVRGVGQKAAALGRVGAGLTTSELGDVATLHDRTLDQSRRQLAGEAASLSLQDQLNKLGAAQGVLGQFGGLDTNAGQLNLGYQQANNAERNAAFGRNADIFGRLTDLSGRENALATQRRGDALDERNAQIEAETRGNALGLTKAQAARQYGNDLYGLQSDAYGRAVGERDASNAYDQQTFGNRRSIFGDAADYASNLDSLDRANRDELRGERNYQYGLSRDAQGDTIGQNAAQEGQFNTDFNRNADLYGIGYGGETNYGNVLGQQAAGAQQNADNALSGVGNLLSAYARGRAGQTPQAPPDVLGNYSTGSRGDLYDISNSVPDVNAPNYQPRTYGDGFGSGNLGSVYPQDWSPFEGYGKDWRTLGGVAQKR